MPNHGYSFSVPHKKEPEHTKSHLFPPVAQHHLIPSRYYLVHSSWWWLPCVCLTVVTFSVSPLLLLRLAAADGHSVEVPERDGVVAPALGVVGLRDGVVVVPRSHELLQLSCEQDFASYSVSKD